MKSFLLFAFIFIFPSLLHAQGLQGNNWQNFYQGDEEVIVSQTSSYSDESVCIKEILDAQKKYGIPDNLLLAIGIQESGRKNSNGVLTAWPWTINSYGEGRWFESKEEALSWLKFRQSKGITSNDVGCMQINLKWHPEAFPNDEDGFNPALNVDYAARFLTSLYEKTGDWQMAAGSYHSFTPEKRNIYLSSLERNRRFANKAKEYFLEVAIISKNDSITFDNNDKRLPIWNSWLTSQQGTSIYANEDFKPILPNYKDN